MALPRELDQVIYGGLQALASNANGELVLRFRRKIWRAFGPVVLDGKKAVIGDALIRRTRLAHRCASQVLPIWYQAFQGDNNPERMLTTAQRYLRGDISWDAAWEIKNRSWSKLDDLINEGKHLNAVYTGYSAANVITTALSDERFALPEVKAAQLDDDLDPYEWDASFCASIAYANGAPWDDQSNKERRREFWKWYLSAAIPEIWKG